jgi:hypothetical protein
LAAVAVAEIQKMVLLVVLEVVQGKLVAQLQVVLELQVRVLLEALKMATMVALEAVGLVQLGKHPQEQIKLVMVEMAQMLIPHGHLQLLLAHLDTTVEVAVVVTGTPAVDVVLVEPEVAALALQTIATLE